MKKIILFLILVITPVIATSQTMGEGFNREILDRFDASLYSSNIQENEDGTKSIMTFFELPSHYDYDYFRLRFNRMVRGYSDIRVINGWRRAEEIEYNTYVISLFLDGESKFDDVFFIVFYNKDINALITSYRRVPK